MQISRVIKEVRKLAEEKPDFVYENKTPGENDEALDCLYRANKYQPGCIFGQAFKRLGITIKKAWEGMAISVILGETKEFRGSGNQRSWCVLVQSKQDRGVSWGRAILDADSHYPLDEH